MVLINYAGREINAKIVYYGPGLSGKTTNLECIYASAPADSRGKMVSMKTRQDRTLFFDFLPLELGEIHGFRTRFLLYTVPGQVFYNATRKLVLKGADAVVFVADSTQGKMDDNLQSIQNLEENLRENNLTLETIPWVIQYNKRDLPQLYTVEQMQQALNPNAVPYFEASAMTGRGVYETLHAVSRMLFQRLRKELGRHSGANSRGGGAEKPAPAQRAAPAEPVAAASPSPITAALGEPTAAASPPPDSAAAPAPAPAPENKPWTPTTASEPAGYGEYGHLVDLSVELGKQSQEVAQPDGFIKDPMRRQSTVMPSPLANAPSPAGPTKSLSVPVVVQAADLKPGTTLRVVLELRIEP
jgi:signal recognition particle receptor subunit beta